MSEKTNLNKGTNTVKLSKEVKAGDIIMVWNSFDSMKPYGAAYTVPAPKCTPEPTVEPTPVPSPIPDTDGDFLTDGKAPTFTTQEHTVTYTDDKGTYSLYGKLYRPVGVEECGVVIFSHGFAGGCDDFPADCKLLAENGYASFTFEFSGGSTKMQSTGRKTTEMSIMTEKKDLLAVFDYVSNLDGIDTRNMFLAGASQGGMISAMTAEELGDKVKGMALYFPAYNIPDDWRKTYPTVSDVPETFDKWGFKLGKVFCTDMIDYYPFEGNNIGKYKGNVLIMQGDADKTVPLKTAEEAVKHYENAELVVYAGEGHGFSVPNAQKAREKLLDFIIKE